VQASQEEGYRITVILYSQVHEARLILPQGLTATARQQGHPAHRENQQPRQLRKKQPQTKNLPQEIPKRVHQPEEEDSTTKLVLSVILLNLLYR
jgi:hypothetical protein